MELVTELGVGWGGEHIGRLSPQQVTELMNWVQSHFPQPGVLDYVPAGFSSHLSGGYKVGRGLEWLAGQGAEIEVRSGSLGSSWC